MIPSMPSLNIFKKSNSDSPEINSGESDAENIPPQLNHFDDDIQTQVSVRSAPNKGIEVVATRFGFYNQDRKREGDIFFIKSEDEFGEWMKCVDSEMEKKRIEFYKNKKAKK